MYISGFLLGGMAMSYGIFLNVVLERQVYYLYCDARRGLAYATYITIHGTNQAEGTSGISTQMRHYLART